jgi:polyhydroxybutyrate depolymerase
LLPVSHAVTFRTGMRRSSARFVPRSLAASLLGALIVACSTSPELPKRTEDFAEVLEVGHQLRDYQVHVPAGYDGNEPQPLLIALHGSGEGATGMRRNTGLDATADADGFVVAYPDGIDRGWSGGSEDVAFIDALIDRLDAYLVLDLDRVYVTGFSAGGMMGHRLACSLTHRLAGAALVAATLPYELAAECRKPFAARLSVMVVLGTGDPLVPFEGDSVEGPGALLSAAETMGIWANRDRCDLSPSVTVVSTDPTYGIVTRREAYPDCAQGVEVELYAMEGAGHFWPSVIFPVNDTIAAFLLRHHR